MCMNMISVLPEFCPEPRTDIGPVDIPSDSEDEDEDVIPDEQYMWAVAFAPDAWHPALRTEM